MTDEQNQEREPKTRKGRKMTSKISTKNQITVPVEIIRSAGLKPGDELDFRITTEGNIELFKVARQLDGWIGSMTGIYDDFDLEAERRAWEERDHWLER